MCGKGGLKEVLRDFYGIQDFCRMWEEWKSVYVLVCDFNEKWLKDLSFFHVLCLYSINKCGR